MRQQKGRVIQYGHHGEPVFVDEELKGAHWDYCLCARCAKFNPEDSSQNCRIAALLYAVCVTFNLVTPVWECPEWKA